MSENESVTRQPVQVSNKGKTRTIARFTGTILSRGGMASLNDIEGGVVEGGSTLIAVGLVALGIVAFMAWRKLTIPVALYPDMLAGNLATGVDRSMSTLGLHGSSWAQKIDTWLANLNIWVDENLPSATKSKGWAAYEAQYTDPGNKIATGMGQGDLALNLNLGGQ